MISLCLFFSSFSAHFIIFFRRNRQSWTFPRIRFLFSLERPFVWPHILFSALFSWSARLLWSFFFQGLVRKNSLSEHLCVKNSIMVKLLTKVGAWNKFWSSIVVLLAVKQYLLQPIKLFSMSCRVYRYARKMLQFWIYTSAIAWVRYVTRNHIYDHVCIERYSEWLFIRCIEISGLMERHQTSTSHV